MIPIKLTNSTWPPPNGSYFSTIILYIDNWNDYGYRTSFVMCYCDDSGNIQEIGRVKIYCWQNDKTRSNNYADHTINSLESSISSLDYNYCSLGQELGYYKNLKTLFPKEYIDLLKRLNDIAVFDDLRERFIDEDGVQTSLLRFSSAEKALHEAKDVVVDSLKTIKDISFKYQVVMPYTTTSAMLNFDFKQDPELPYRINALIGKNGTGKTQLLSRLANSLSGYTDELEKNIFVDHRPPVDKVMSISYSAFDRFRKPPEDREERSVFSYVYCGIQSEHGTLSISQLQKNLQDAYSTIKKRGREGVWHDVLAELMECEHRETIQLIADEQFDAVNLSSGQHILICTMTELIANIENESILLFDEPEIHLHPYAISNTIRMFYRLLEKFNSYAIFSTHSPLILQEIPSKYIQILDRIDGILTIRRPDVECFGNNINEIISDVFDVTATESNYRTILMNLSKTKSYDDIVQIFGGQLGLNALIYLKTCYERRE